MKGVKLKGVDRTIYNYQNLVFGFVVKIYYNCSQKAKKKGEAVET